MSIKPGVTINPDASNSSAPAGDRSLPTPRMRPSSIHTSATPSNPDAGSITRPFLMTSAATENPFEHRHPHRNAILNLIQNHRPLRIRHLRRNLAAPVDRSRMHHDHI